MKVYKGFNIYQAGRNSSGIKWYCFTENGRLIADTLCGMKELINDFIKENKQ